MLDVLDALQGGAHRYARHACPAHASSPSHLLSHPPPTHTTGPPEKDADGRYPCDKCDSTFESFRALGIHSRTCDGGNWSCQWCETKDKAAGKENELNAKNAKLEGVIEERTAAIEALKEEK